MRKPSGKITEHIISDVSIGKKNVTLIIEDEEYTISQDVYLSYYFYPGKSISKEEMDAIIRSGKSTKAAAYCSSLLSRRRYTVKEIHDKIRSKFTLTEKELTELLKPYIEAGVLNDKEYALDYAQSKAECGYGKKLIWSQLKEKGIAEEILKGKDMKDAWTVSLENLPLIIEKYDHSKSQIPVRKKKEMTLSMLLRRGYSMEASKAAIDDFYNCTDAADEEKMRQVLKKEATKCYNSLAVRNMDPHKKKDALIRKLLSKGFGYEEIMEEINMEEYRFR